MVVVTGWRPAGLPGQASGQRQLLSLAVISRSADHKRGCGAQRVVVCETARVGLQQQQAQPECRDFSRMEQRSMHARACKDMVPVVVCSDERNSGKDQGTRLLLLEAKGKKGRRKDAKPATLLLQRYLYHYLRKAASSR